jgi:hypothetical protein
MLWMAMVERSRWDLQPQHREGLLEPLTQARRRAGMGPVQLAGHRGQLRLGVQGGGGVVGGAHRPLDRAAKPLGQLVADVAELMQVAITG